MECALLQSFSLVISANFTAHRIILNYDVAKLNKGWYDRNCHD